MSVNLLCVVRISISTDSCSHPSWGSLALLPETPQPVGYQAYTCNIEREHLLKRYPIYSVPLGLDPLHHIVTQTGDWPLG